MMAEKFREGYPDFDVKILNFDNDGLVVER
jgi:hypothetical protein